VAFEVREVREDGRVVFLVSGEIDLATAGDLRETLLAAVDSRPLWVDLTEVEFMDSTGLNALVVAHHASDGSLVVVCPEGPPRRALEISGLHQVLNVVTSR
jgi:anti-sigma B factor antagonist